MNLTAKSPQPLTPERQTARLRALIDRCRRAPGARVVFDLDGTLIDTSHRNRAIIDDLASEHRTRFPDLSERLLQAQSFSHAFFSTLLRRLGVEEPDFSALRDLWRPRFFGDRYLRHDRALPGAVEFVRSVRAAGATVVYFTARDRQRMLAGTVTSLRDLGFPIGDLGVELVMKPGPEQTDRDYKRALATQLAASKAVIAAFDNEPAHCNALLAALTSAEVYLLTTGHLPGAPPADAGVIALSDLRLEAS